MRQLCTYILVLISIHCFAQQQVQFYLVERDSKVPISNAYVYSDTDEATSNSNGLVKIDFNEKLQLKITHLSYRDTVVSFDALLTDTIELTKAINVLKQVEVDSRPYIVFKSDEYHVFDYEFLGDTLLILTYEREKMFRRQEEQSDAIYLGCQILAISPSGNILTSRKLMDEIVGFHRDPLDQIYIKSRKAIYSVQYNMQLSLAALDLKTFKEQVEPIKASLSNLLVVDNYRWHYPEFSYYSVKRNSDSLKLIRTIKDDFTMELLRSEYKYMNNRDKLLAYRQELETGVDKEVISAYKTGFQSSLYYQPCYAPVFSSDSLLWIFDHHAGFIFTHSLTNSLRDSVELGYTDGSRLKFDDLVLRDRKKPFFYSVFKKGAHKYLGRINLSSGDISELTKLYYPFPEKIKVQNGSAYYLYRKPESKNYTYLFAEKLK